MVIATGNTGYSLCMPDDAYCPHCRNLLRASAPYPYPSGPTRCRACLLLVSAGRSCTSSGQRRVPSAFDTARRVAPGTRPGPVTAGPAVDVVQAVLREVDGYRSAL
jgi:hypothetical protein